MYKFILVAITLCFTLEACSTLDSVTSGVQNVFKSDATRTAEESAQDATIWNIDNIDTVRSVTYLSDIEKDIILEMNKVRTNPAKYAELYIAPRAARFSGNIYNGTLRTNEGAAAVNECVSALTATKALTALQPAQALSRAAQQHARTQGATAQTGHTVYSNQKVRRHLPHCRRKYFLRADNRARDCGATAHR